MRSLIALLLLGVVPGCTGAEGSAGAPERCVGHDLERQAQDYSPCRVFTGRLRLPQQKQLSQPDRPFQVVAIGFAPTVTTPATDAGASAPDSSVSSVPGQVTDKVAPRLFYGVPFAAVRGGGQRDAAPFSVVVPCTLSVNLLLQIPRTSGDTEPGILVAPMEFARSSGTGTTTLIPRQSADACSGKAALLDLGLVDLELLQRDNLTTGRITLGKGNSVSPLSLVPAPEGQISDQDTDGDGILDSAETLGALEDKRTPGLPPDPSDPENKNVHPDGIPDIFQERP